MHFIKNIMQSYFSMCKFCINFVRQTCKHKNCEQTIIRNREGDKGSPDKKEDYSVSHSKWEQYDSRAG